jgi:hypothetical protein
MGTQKISKLCKYQFVIPFSQSVYMEASEFSIELVRHVIMNKQLQYMYFYGFKWLRHIPIKESKFK